jgi:hypothetical protein
MIEFRKLETEPEYDEGKERIGSFFLDSGAHSLYTKFVMKSETFDSSKGVGFSGNYVWYESEEFWQYVDDYAAFVKANRKGIDYYANVDVIFNPQKTWDVQCYLEDQHKLKPVPVIHYGTDIKWIERYLDRGHFYLGLGGLGQEVTSSAYRQWGDEVYRFLCPGKERLPIAKTHGFAMTAFPLLMRYPWYSVDSASWIKAGGFGNIYVPHMRRGEFVFRDFAGDPLPPYSISVSHESPRKVEKGRHVNQLPSKQRKVLQAWLEFIGVPYGKVENGEAVSWGVYSNDRARYIANQRFFLFLCDSLPNWPWRFNVSQVKPSFGF